MDKRNKSDVELEIAAEQLAEIIVEIVQAKKIKKLDRKNKRKLLNTHKNKLRFVRIEDLR